MHIVENKYEDRRNKLCKCCVCGKVERCTVVNDFYDTKDHGDGLVCESCLLGYLAKKGCK